ncbi:MAG TPA: hypothetical protein VGA56_04395 [Opitutaceae bacterium]
MTPTLSVEAVHDSVIESGVLDGAARLAGAAGASVSTTGAPGLMMPASKVDVPVGKK